jgi:PEP-CTERM motif
MEYQMFKRTAIVFSLGLAGLVSAHAAVNVGGRVYADEAVVNVLLGSVGTYTFSGGTLASSLTDTDAGTYAFSFSRGASLDLGWTLTSVLNGAGTDIDLYELGVDGVVEVTLNGTTKAYTLTNTGFSAGGFNLNRASVDLSDFGFAAGAAITAIHLGMDNTGNSSFPVPSVSFVAATNIGMVPEPSTYALMALGLAAVAGVARKRAR